MLRLSQTFNIPPSILFFPELELEKRRIFNTVMQICVEVAGITEQEFLTLLSEAYQEKGEPKTLTFEASELQDMIAPFHPQFPAHTIQHGFQSVISPMSGARS